jgi:hypothetical protein
MDDHTAEIETMKVAAAALVDLKTFNSGRALFKRENQQRIFARRAEIMTNDPKASSVGAYQTAFKELWGETNQRYWEDKAAGESKDVYECVILTFGLISSNTLQKPAAFPEILVLQSQGFMPSGGIR